MTPRTTLRGFGIWTAVARNQALSTREGHVHGRDLYLVGLRRRWLLTEPKGVQVAYAADLLPAVISGGMTEYALRPAPLPPGCRTEYCTLPIVEQIVPIQRTVYGAGLSPLGIDARVGGRGPIGLVTHLGVGLVYFSRRVPDPAATRLNAIVDAGAAAEIRVSQRYALTAGYRFNHISNGGRGEVNPGMNSNMLELGFTVAR